MVRVALSQWVQLILALLQKYHLPEKTILHQSPVSAMKPALEKIPDQGPEELSKPVVQIRSGFCARVLLSCMGDTTHSSCSTVGGTCSVPLCSAITGVLHLEIPPALVGDSSPGAVAETSPAMLRALARLTPVHLGAVFLSRMAHSTAQKVLSSALISTLAQA